MERLADGAGTGCHVCTMILSNLSRTGFSSDGLPSELGDSMYVKIWHDRSVDFFTGDQRDEVRYDASCLGQIARMEVKSIKGPLAEMLLNMGDSLGSDENTGSENALATVKHWITDCTSNHVDCKVPGDSATADTILPTRVIDVGPSDGSLEPRLHVTNGSTGKYIALSHCWGARPVLQTTSKNLTSHLLYIPDAFLPKTFLDAISLCRKLNVRYLWIDSLCIIQDSDEDWQREALLMGSVYRNAYLTIAAASAKDSSEGCFLPRKADKIRPCWSGMTDGFSPEDKESTNPLFIRPHRDPVSEAFAQLRPTMNMGILAHRGWTLQEQILSRRVVWYHSDMLYWTCLTSEASEQLPEGISGKQFQDLNYWLVVQQAIHGVADLSRPEVVQGIYAAWYRLTMEYSGRTLTYDKDRVYALAGLACEMEKVMAKVAVLQAKDADTFIAGLWKRDLWRGLLWTMTDADYSNLGAKRPQPVLAPTWSWVSIKGFVNYLTYGSRIKDLEPPDPVEPMTWDWDVHISILDVSPMPTDATKFNPQVDGRLIIKGLVRDGLAHGRADLTDPATGDKWGVWLRDEEGWLPRAITCLAVASMVPKGELEETQHVWCLLLEPVDGLLSTYRRVGAGKIFKATGWLRDTVESTIHLI
ncbi:Fc.00g054130.m01.CDS01 [Cosmosporella sp. VM-42]